MTTGYIYIVESFTLNKLVHTDIVIYNLSICESRFTKDIYFASEKEKTNLFNGKSDTPKDKLIKHYQL